jgi:hypothetical protein
MPHQPAFHVASDSLASAKSRRRLTLDDVVDLYLTTSDLGGDIYTLRIPYITQDQNSSIYGCINFTLTVRPPHSPLIFRAATPFSFIPLCGGTTEGKCHLLMGEALSFYWLINLPER